MATLEDAAARIEFDPEVIDALDDADSLAETTQSRNSSTASISSSILEYRKIHGRTYQSTGTTEYWAPNDDQHVEGFDVGHHWLTMMLGDKLYLPPIGKHPQRILDVGTGSGIWAIDMADTFPSAEVIGVDISPTQPSWVPPNVSFQIDDAQLDWTFQPESFDFIHIRCLHGGIEDWQKIYNQLYKFLKPGGWFQQMEPGLSLRCENPAVTVDDNHIYQQWTKLFANAGEKFGRTFDVQPTKMAEWASNAGFTDITQKTFKVPYGEWPKDKRLKELGNYVKFYMDLSLNGFVLYPIGEVLGWSYEEVEVLVAKMRAAIHNPRNMTNGDMYVVYGQKPKDVERLESQPSPRSPVTP